MIWAPGAMACAHSTSSDSSTSQLSVPGPFGSVEGSDVAWPYWLRTVRNDEAGPYCWIECRAGMRQAELRVERVDGLVDVRIVVGIDDGDRLAGAVLRQRG